MEEKFEKKELSREQIKKEQQILAEQHDGKYQIEETEVLENMEEENHVPKKANYEEELLEIIRSDEPASEKLDRLDDYHENDIASALEYLESAERKQL